MKILLDCFGSHDDLCGCDFALVDLDPQGVRLLLDRHAKFTEFSKATGANEARWFYGNPVFFSVYGGDDDSRPTKDERQRVEEVLELLGQELHAVVPDDLDIPDSMIARTECEEVVVCDEGVWFTCFPKYTEVLVATRVLPMEVLETVTRGAKRTPKEEVTHG